MPSNFQRLKVELELAKPIVDASEPWVMDLRKRLAVLTRDKEALPAVASFFAQWSFPLLRGICALIELKMYSAALLLLRSLIEAYLEIIFILQQDCERRAAEYLSAGKENRSPYRDRPEFEAYSSIGKRANKCGLGELYHKTYLSLCNYSHLRVRGSLAFDPDSEKAVEEARACLIVGEAIFAKMARHLSKFFDFHLPEGLIQKYAACMGRYQHLIREQERLFAQRQKALSANPEAGAPSAQKP